MSFHLLFKPAIVWRGKLTFKEISLDFITFDGCKLKQNELMSAKTSKSFVDE